LVPPSPQTQAELHTNVAEAAAQPAPARRPAPAAGRAIAGANGKIGRNDPCPCGSGKKYKFCHGANANGAPQNGPLSVPAHTNGAAVARPETPANSTNADGQTPAAAKVDGKPASSARRARPTRRRG